MRQVICGAGLCGAALAEDHCGWSGLLDLLNAERIVTTVALVGATHLAIGLAVD